MEEKAAIVRRHLKGEITRLSNGFLGGAVSALSRSTVTRARQVLGFIEPSVRVILVIRGNSLDGWGSRFLSTGWQRSKRSWSGDNQNRFVGWIERELQWRLPRIHFA